MNESQFLAPEDINYPQKKSLIAQELPINGTGSIIAIDE